MAVAVAAHETGYFQSHLAQAHNNLFGMMHPSERTTTSVGSEDSGFATYTSPQQSARDFVLYLKSQRYDRDYATIDDLIQAMKRRGYFEDNLSNYLTSTRAIYEAN